MPLLRLAAPLALILALIVPAAAPAAMVNLTYSGSDPDDDYITSSGPASFSFATGKTTLGRADLTAFSFSFTIVSNDPGLKYVDTFTYSLSDLVSFSATVSATGQLTALAFQTGYQSPPDNFLAPQYLVARSLSRGGLVSYFGPGDDAQHGTITPSVVPEPASLALTAIAVTLGMGIARGRRPRLHRA